MNKRVLVLGATGMVGHVVYIYLNNLQKYEISNIVFKTKLNDSSIIVDVTKKETLENTIKKIQPDVLINCVGVLIKGSNTNPADAIYINSYLPHLLSKVLNTTGGKLIQISTDCVFSGDKGSYSESDFKDAIDTYGKTKGLGEVINNHDLVLRTSIIGPELKLNGEGLLHWFLTQKGEINGYTKSIWSGVTNLQLAKIIEIAIDKNITGLYHLTNGEKINKYDLLVLAKKIFDLKNINIKKMDGKNIDKSLVDNRKEPTISVPSYEIMLTEIYTFMQKHKKYYNHYSLQL